MYVEALNKTHLLGKQQQQGLVRHTWWRWNPGRPSALACTSSRRVSSTMALSRASCRVASAPASAASSACACQQHRKALPSTAPTQVTAVLLRSNDKQASGVAAPVGNRVYRIAIADTEATWQAPHTGNSKRTSTEM